MKRSLNHICALFFAGLVFACLCAAGCTAKDAQPQENNPSPEHQPTPVSKTKTQDIVTAAGGAFSVTSSGISGGTISDEYGKRGSQKAGLVPTLSLPLSINNPPEGTACFALTMIDPDSEPLCGYAWVHWLACGFTETNLPANASIDAANAMIQGKNGFGQTGYGGPVPPDKPHTYVITVYALDASPALAEGFSQDDLLFEIKGHVLAAAQISATYAN